MLSRVRIYEGMSEMEVNSGDDHWLVEDSYDLSHFTVLVRPGIETEEVHIYSFDKEIYEYRIIS